MGPWWYNSGKAWCRGDDAWGAVGSVVWSLVLRGGTEAEKGFWGVFWLLEVSLMNSDRWYCNKIMTSASHWSKVGVDNIYNVPDYWLPQSMPIIHLCLLSRFLSTTVWIWVLGLAFDFNLHTHNQLHFQHKCWLGEIVFTLGETVGCGELARMASRRKFSCWRLSVRCVWCNIYTNSCLLDFRNNPYKDHRICHS